MEHLFTLILNLFRLSPEATAPENLPQPAWEIASSASPASDERVGDLASVAPAKSPKPVKGEDHPLSLKSFFNQPHQGTNFTVGNLLTDWGTHKSYYATYQSDGLKISATWHVPAGEGPFPLLVLNHGYFPPETYTNGYGFGREQKYFANEGYAVLHIDYRGYAYSDKDPQALSGRRPGYTGYGADAINAILAIQAAELDYVDTSRVGMLGHSLGGGVTLAAALARPDLIDAAVLWGPVSSDYFDNFTKWSKNRLTEDGKKLLTENFGPIDKRETFAAFSPRTYLNQLQTPLLIQQGTADEDCPVEWARATKAELARLNQSFEYREYEDYPHVFWGERWDKAVTQAADFLTRQLET